MFIKESKSGDSNLFEIYLYSFSASCALNNNLIGNN